MSDRDLTAWLVVGCSVAAAWCAGRAVGAAEMAERHARETIDSANVCLQAVAVSGKAAADEGAEAVVGFNVPTDSDYWEG